MKSVQGKKLPLRDHGSESVVAYLTITGMKNIK